MLSNFQTRSGLLRMQLTAQPKGDDRIHIRICIAAASVTLILACAPSSDAALTFSQSQGSPYATTNPPFVANSGGFLGGAATGDFNDDGISDVAVVNETGVPVFSPGESVSVLLGSRSGGLTLAPGSPVSIYSEGNTSAAGPIATGDFNGDGNTDLAVVDGRHNTIAILLGNGKGEFHMSGAPTPFAGSGDTSSIAVGDFNGDGKQDVAVVNENLDIMLGNGSGGLTQAPASPLTLPTFGSSVVAGSFNGDGQDDLAVADISGHVSVYLSNAAGEMTATAQSPLSLGSGSGDMASADFNHDGKADLAVVNPGNSNVAVLLGDGAGNFTPASGSPFPVPGGASSSQPGLPESIAVGNFACNEVPDLAIANFNGSSDTVAVLEGDGSGAFTSPIGSLFPANGNPRPIVVGDLNGDGKPDIAVVNSFQGTITELENTTNSEQCAHIPPPPLPKGPGGMRHHQPTGFAPQGPPSIETLALQRHVIHTGHSLSLRVTLSGSTTIVVEFEKNVLTHGRELRRLVGTVTLAGHLGANSFTIKRVRDHRLAAGRYTLIVFTRIGDKKSAARTVSLIVRR
jgi:hypothetical protein